MQLSEPVDWVGKSFIGYVMNTEFSGENTVVLAKLIEQIKAEFNDSVFCMPPSSLHITLLDWIAPLVDYDGQDKDRLFTEIQPSYDKAISEALTSVGPIEVHFNEIKTSPSTIYIVGQDNGQYDEIRKQFLSKVELLQGTKLPPNIVHSSVARYTKPIDLETVNAFLATKKLDLTQTVSSFRLIRATREPTLEFETLKRYELS